MKERPSSEARTHLLKMRRLMRDEASTLAKELSRCESALKQRLKSLEKRLHKDSDTIFLSELGDIRDELDSVRRGLARISISEQPTIKLKNEWHDWDQHAEMSAGMDHAFREERLEMLSSELRLRGYGGFDVLRVASDEESETGTVETQEWSVGEAANGDEGRGLVEEPIEEDALQIVEVPEEQDEETDWIEAGDYWERLIRGCNPQYTDASQLARLLCAFREVQGERKRQERRRGIERYRLGAFETWV